MKPTFRSAAIVMASSAALALAACGNNNNAPAANAPAAPAPDAAPAAPVTPTADIMTSAAASPDTSSLFAAIQAAGLGERLSGNGPFTVFAPTNAAFDAIPAAARSGNVTPEQKRTLAGILAYHVVPGRLTAADIAAQAAANGGTASLTTIQGGKLSLKDAGGGMWEVTDAKGNKAKITLADQERTNGVVHVIDKVLAH